MSDESNYETLRERMNLEHWEDDEDGGGGLVTDTPTNEQILKLLDALNADIKGEVLPEVSQVLMDRQWNS